LFNVIIGYNSLYVFISFIQTILLTFKTFLNKRYTIGFIEGITQEPSYILLSNVLPLTCAKRNSKNNEA